jgi:putative membrane protein
MARFLIRLVICAIGLWVTTAFVSGVKVEPYADDTLAYVVTFLVSALVFTIVNAIVGTVVRIVAFPLYLLTLGLLSLIVNGLLLMLAAALTHPLGFGIRVDGFWWGVLGALVLGIVNWVLGLIVRPVLRR